MPEMDGSDYKIRRMLDWCVAHYKDGHRYDPDCDGCKEVVKRLRSIAFIKKVAADA